MYPRLRTPVVVLSCVLAAAGCATGTTAPAEPAPPAPLTATDALGDFGTVDYCSLLDVPGSVAVPAFDDCRSALGSRTILVGPLAYDSDPNIKPYPYLGPVPDGVAVQESTFNDGSACTRAITFADGNRLPLSVTDSGSGDQGGRCEVADEAVGSALKAITSRQVRRQAFPERSWGRVLACAMLDTHDLDGPAGPGTQPSGGLTGHSCIRGNLSLKLTVEATPSPAPAEQLGGREAHVRVADAFCLVDTTQPAPGLPGRRELAEISVVETTGTAGDGTCAVARTAANSILPKLPRA